MAKAKPKKTEESPAKRTWRSLVTGKLVLTEEELLETWGIIRSICAEGVLEKLTQGEMTSTSAMSNLASCARQELEAIEARIAGRARAAQEAGRCWIVLPPHIEYGSNRPEPTEASDGG